MSKLIPLIDQLSKSSSQAVYTPKDMCDHEPSSIFDYLYIETPIEKKYKKLLGEKRESKSIIFLCGSSGDGKSAIIGQNQKFFSKYYDVHIDATHSFRPDQTAIEALNDVFDRFKQSSKSLVVGINMGILLNFSRNGSDFHNDIKDAIKMYDLSGISSDNVYFINFEDYPKFKMLDGNITSEFIIQLLQKVVAKEDSNPFYVAYREDLNNNIRLIDHQNFYLLGLEAIQKSIVELLVTVHLKYDQFLTTRSLLDLIYVLLRDPRSLIDQLFEHDSNPILENTYKEDPILIRTQQLDTFVLERSNHKKDQELEDFVHQFNQQSGFQILNINDVHTLVRTFYIFREYDCANNYHKKFENDFSDDSILEYIKLIDASHNYSLEKRPVLQSFYKKMCKAIFAYANKHHPELSSEDLFQCDTINGFSVCVPLELTTAWSKIESNKLHKVNSFPCYFKVGETLLDPIDISLNMYKLTMAINQGYRPNKHDRNTIIIFEELLEKIASIAKLSNKLVFVKGKKQYSFKNTLDEIKVSLHD
jgi:DNA phosphorothioation-dependent restriction protein DptF